MARSDTMFPAMVGIPGIAAFFRRNYKGGHMREDAWLKLGHGTGLCACDAFSRGVGGQKGGRKRIGEAKRTSYANDRMLCFGE